MSLDAMIWAMKDAPVRDVQERVVLGVMAEAADDDGEGCWLSTRTIAERAMLSEREVRDCQKTMMARHLLGLGDQTRARGRADRRPKVYDLLIPLTMFANAARINRYREQQGRPGPLTKEARPDIAAAPPKKRRADLGTKRVKPDGVTASPPVDGVTSSPGGLQAQHGVTTSTSAPYIDPVVNPLLLATDPEPPTQDPPSNPLVVVVDQPANTEDPAVLSIAADVLTAAQKASSLPAARWVRGDQSGKLVALLAERLRAGWTPEHATDALTGAFNGGPVSGALRYRITNNLAGDPPDVATSAASGRWAVPWCGRCSHAESRRRVDLDTVGVTGPPCQTCGQDSMRSEAGSVA